MFGCKERSIITGFNLIPKIALLLSNCNSDGMFAITISFTAWNESNSMFSNAFSKSVFCFVMFTRELQVFSEQCVLLDTPSVMMWNWCIFQIFGSSLWAFPSILDFSWVLFSRTWGNHWWLVELLVTYLINAGISKILSCFLIFCFIRPKWASTANLVLPTSNSFHIFDGIVFQTFFLQTTWTG